MILGLKGLTEINAGLKLDVHVRIPWAPDTLVNPLRPNNGVSQTSHFNIKGVSVSEVMRIENMITQVQVY